jgi:Phage protein
VSDTEWTRPPPRKPRALAPGRPTVLSIFYGYPDELVARWCGVTPSAVRQYKNGKRRPSKAVVRLFMLHRDRRVLGPEWKGWILKPDGIVDPDGNETSRSQLHNYFWIVQLARRLAYERDDPLAQGEFEKLLG